MLYQSCHTTVYRECLPSEDLDGTDVQVNIRNIELVNNPAKYDDEYHFRIKFEAISALAEGTSADGTPLAGLKLIGIDLEWKLVYVGSANSEDFDQELDSCMGQ